jgi:GxxExxY protein
MPIICPVQFQRTTEAEFHELDYQVMERVFATHNALGRFCDEVIYHNDLTMRLTDAGMGKVLSEVPVVVSWRDFRKTYYLDLVLGTTHLYELKTATNLAGEHEARTLHYLLVVGANHGKLINFRPASVQWRFVSTTLTPEECRRFTIEDTSWRELDPACVRLRQILQELLHDWGAFLELELYEEALTWFLGGEAKVAQRVEMKRDGAFLGTQKMAVHAPGVAFKLTATTENQARVEAHLRRLLAHTSLKGLQWINFNHHSIELKTLFQQ